MIAIGDNKTPKAFATAISTMTPNAGTVPTSPPPYGRGTAGYLAGTSTRRILDNNGLVNYITSKGYLDFTAKGKTLDPAMGFWVNRP